MLVRAEGSIKSPLGRLIADTTRLQLLLKTSAKAGDLLLIAAGAQERVVCTTHMTTHTHSSRSRNDTRSFSFIRASKCSCSARNATRYFNSTLDRRLFHFFFFFPSCETKQNRNGFLNQQCFVFDSALSADRWREMTSWGCNCSTGLKSLVTILTWRWIRFVNIEPFIHQLTSHTCR